MSEYIYQKHKVVNSNFIRSKILGENNKRIKPRQSDIETYRKWLEDTYTETLKNQLGISGGRHYFGSKSAFGGNQSRSTYSNLGIDTKQLKKSARGTAQVFLERDKINNRVYIKYRLKNSESILKYGGYISNGRKAGGIPTKFIIEWLRHKNIKLRPPTQRDAIAIMKGKLSQTDLRKKIAYLIVTKAAANRSPAVIPDWDNLNKNKRFKTMFYEKIKKEGRTHRNRIRRGIMRNFNKK